MKKLLIPALVATLALTACQKPDDTKANEPAPKTEQTTAPADTPKADDHAHEHHEHEGHDHAHGEHDHDHDHAGHDHHHDDGDKYQCGDKSVTIAVHDHEGEIEAHLTADDVTYDLDQDTKNKERFISSDDSIVGDDKGMALTINGNKAKVSTLDDKVLLDCTKAS